jgi:hypothetical protein
MSSPGTCVALPPHTFRPDSPRDAEDLETISIIVFCQVVSKKLSGPRATHHSFYLLRRCKSWDNLFMDIDACRSLAYDHSSLHVVMRTLYTGIPSTIAKWLSALIEASIASMVGST